MANRQVTGAMDEIRCMGYAGCEAEFPLECMEIIRRWSDGGHGFAYCLMGILEAIGRAGPDKIRGFMRSWAVCDDDARSAHVAIPHTYKSGGTHLICLLRSFDLRDEKDALAVIMVLEQVVLEEEYDRRHTRAFYDECERLNSSECSRIKHI